MEYEPITAVGIDVSKGKSTVAVRRPGGEVVLTPFQVNHDAAGLSSLVKTLRGIDGDIRIVMEHTGRTAWPVFHCPHFLLFTANGALTMDTSFIHLTLRKFDVPVVARRDF